ncbi:hypothetical protein AB0F96_25675 [Streptomyces sp. NPDC023998]|uniref:hypothetical protein n=1 Tax=Streptomyces sp. NPDC023998 TaxID=3154597 RepID=UPI0033DEF484
MFEPIREWPLCRRLTGADRLGRGRAAMSPRMRVLRPAADTADRLVRSTCPYPSAGRPYAADEAAVGAAERPRPGAPLEHDPERQETP